MKILRNIVIVLIFLVLFILSLLTLPTLVIDYKGCIEKKETKIVENLRVYEFITKTRTDEYKYDAPFICVEGKYSICDMFERHSLTPLKEISANKVITTGRAIKRYYFPNFFTFLLTDAPVFRKTEVLEVLINNKRYWTSSAFYDHMTLGNATWPNESKIEICPIYTIRGFTFAY